jgi:DNA-binding transcriptional LysR family regulator
MQSEPRGILRVNAPMSFGFLHLGPAVVDFMRAHPKVAIDISLNDRFVDLVEEGYDVAIRIGRLQDSSMIARKIATSRTVICAAPEYLARRGEPASPKAIGEHDCMLYSLRSPVDRWTLIGPEGEIEIPVTGALVANNGDILRTATLAGQGIGNFPTFLVGEDLRAGRLVRVLPDYCGRDNDINALYPSNRQLSAKVRVFIDFLVERFGPEPPWEQN